MASLSAGRPVTAEYFVNPLRMDSMAAAFASSGVSRSGSPAPRLSTSLPSAFKRLYLASMATVWDVEMLPAREARGFIILLYLKLGVAYGMARRRQILIHP